MKTKFAFLERDFGFELQARRLDRWSRRWVPSLVCKNATTGVFIEYDVRDSYLKVVIFELQNGDIPNREGYILCDKGYALNHVVLLKNPEDAVGSSDFEGEDWLDAYFSKVAENLKTHASDLLSGNFEKGPEINAMGRSLAPD